MNEPTPPSLPPLPDGRADRPAHTSGHATASLILGVLSCGFSCLTGIPAVICAAVGLNRIAKSEQSPAGPILTGRGMAIAGIMLGSLSLFVTPALVGLLLPAVQSAREAARRTQCYTNVRSLAQAMIVAESATQKIPAAIVDENGRPLLSWRVAMLPYIDDTLYQQFHLDEPWDSDHNKRLIPLMPSVYVCPSSGLDPAEGKTCYLAAAGPGMALADPVPIKVRGPGGARLVGVTIGSLTDGMSKTVLIIEAAPQDAVPWTKPADFDVAPAEAAQRLFAGSSHGGGIHAAVFGDTHVEPLTPDIDPARLAAILTKSGGERVPIE